MPKRTSSPPRRLVSGELWALAIPLLPPRPAAAVGGWTGHRASMTGGRWRHPVRAHTGIGWTKPPAEAWLLVRGDLLVASARVGGRRVVAPAAPPGAQSARQTRAARLVPHRIGQRQHLVEKGASCPARTPRTEARTQPSTTRSLSPTGCPWPSQSEAPTARFHAGRADLRQPSPVKGSATDGPTAPGPAGRQGVRQQPGPAATYAAAASPPASPAAASTPGDKLGRHGGLSNALSHGCSASAALPWATTAAPRPSLRWPPSPEPSSVTVGSSDARRRVRSGMGALDDDVAQIRTCPAAEPVRRPR